MATRFATDSLNLAPFSLQSSGGGDYASAGAVVSAPANYQAQRSFGPRFDQLSAQAMTNDAQLEAAAVNAIASTYGTGISTFGQTAGTFRQAEAYEKAAEEAAKAKQNAAGLAAGGGIVSSLIGLIPGIG